jgi:hypothetical protein
MPCEESAAASSGGSITASKASVIESECARRAGCAGAAGWAGAGAAGWTGDEAAGWAAARGAEAGAGAGADGPAAGVAAGAAGGDDLAEVCFAGDFAGAGAGELDDEAGDCLAPRAGGGVGAGGGDSTIVGSRSAEEDGVRGTLGNAPPRVGVRGSGGAADGGGSDDEAAEGAEGAEADDEDADRSPARRGSRCGPWYSQIERGDSVGVCGTAVLAGVANAGVSPGSDDLKADPADAAGSSAGGAGATGGGGAGGAGGAVISGSSFIALPLSSPAGASDGLPS